MGVAVARQIAKVGKRLVAGIEQAQLHELVRLDILNNLHADLLERRAAQGEVIFQHPLGKRLAHHGPGIFNAKALGELFDIRGRGHWRDAVYHGVGERHLGGQPVAQLRTAGAGVGAEHTLGDIAVALNVIAGHHRKRRNTPCPAAYQGFHH